jgi:hypothetical protein
MTIEADISELRTAPRSLPLALKLARMGRKCLCLPSGTAMTRTYPADPRRTPLYTAWQQARDRFHAHGFDQSRYEAVFGRLGGRISRVSHCERASHPLVTHA